MDIENKLNKIIEISRQFMGILPYRTDSDTFKCYTISLDNSYAEFTTYFYNDNKHFKTYIKGIGEYPILEMEISKRDDYFKKGIYLTFKELDEHSNIKIELSESDIHKILDRLIYELNISLNEHRYLTAPDETIQKLKELLKEDVTILIHGTDKSHIDSILNQGLKTNYKSICRTTAMLKKDINNIISYNYGWNLFRPRNVLFAIDNAKITSLNPQLIGNKNFQKCAECTMKSMRNFDLWCYEQNYLFELISEQVDDYIIIPPKYIYGVLDLNGNLSLNPNFNPEINSPIEDLKIRQKKLENTLCPKN